MDMKTILFVDDEEMIRDLLSNLLSKLGHKVIMVENGHQAVEVFKEKHNEIDLAIIDLYMPEMSGPETLIQLRSINPDLSVIFSSGQADLNAESEALKMGANYYLAKPYRVSRLTEAIEVVLEGKIAKQPPA